MFDRVGATALSATRRTRELDELSNGGPVDVLVIGGGVTGTGVALDAASRGLTVALVERHDLAAGTSRWSSKLAHGGLRYIAGGQLGVAWESAVERNRLATAIAPHLVRPLSFLMPMYADNPPVRRAYPRGSAAASRALFVVADVMRAAARTPAWLPPTTWIGAGETRHLVPTIGPIRGSFVHVDGALEDDARLVVALARTAAGFGARILTRCSAIDVARAGATVRDELTGAECDIDARAVVVAAGVWSGNLVDDVRLTPGKGAHLVLPAAALDYPQAAFNVLLPGSRNRFVFAAPRPDGLVLVGLTDDPVDTIEDVPSVSADDERFLLETLSTGLSRPVGTDDVIGRYAGLRPLLGDRAQRSADISRRHALLERDGVLVIVGGKLTTYRRMAQDAVDRVATRLDHRRPCRTAALPLVGATTRPGPEASRLRRRFGAEAAMVADAVPVGGLEAIAPGVPALRCEVPWAVAVEGALDAADVLDRRLRLDLVPAWRAAAAPYVEEMLAEQAGQR
ncbi:MAG TPA: glycerol-3-phosphate dehydrogenase/oxidase [Mycobacteriales bacterium]|nr:glycerol-3-phosphate dehydrogenase/oxidase [Mycobacteriales bacterium]